MDGFGGTLAFCWAGHAACGTSVEAVANRRIFQGRISGRLVHQKKRSAVNDTSKDLSSILFNP